jgi:hypothetical protein
MRKREKEDEKQRLEAKRLKEVADHEERRAGAFFSFFSFALEAKRLKEVADHEERRAGLICVYTYTHICINTYMYTHTHTHTQTHTHTHTHSGEAARRTADRKGAFSRAKMRQVQPGVLERQKPRRAVRSQR